MRPTEPQTVSDASDVWLSEPDRPSGTPQAASRLSRWLRNSGLLVGSLLFSFLGTGCDKMLSGKGVQREASKAETIGSRPRHSDFKKKVLYFYRVSDPSAGGPLRRSEEPRFACAYLVETDDPQVIRHFDILKNGLEAELSRQKKDAPAEENSARSNPSYAASYKVTQIGIDGGKVFNVGFTREMLIAGFDDARFFAQLNEVQKKVSVFKQIAQTITWAGTTIRALADGELERSDVAVEQAALDLKRTLLESSAACRYPSAVKAAGESALDDLEKAASVALYQEIDVTYDAFEALQAGIRSIGRTSEHSNPAALCPTSLEPVLEQVTRRCR